VANELVALAHVCRDTTELHERVRFAEEIVVRVGPMLRVFVARRCPPAAVDDVVQETLIGIGRGAGGFLGKTDREFWSWCYKIAFYKLSNHFRREGVQQTASLDNEEIWRAVEATMEDSTMQPGDRLDLEEAMNLLRQSNPPCVGYLTLHFIEGLDFAELATLYHSTPSAIRMQIIRCLSLAHKMLTKTSSIYEQR
jgi:RNA polymerase sigma-70 factor (ECF subfamily)